MSLTLEALTQGCQLSAIDLVRIDLQRAYASRGLLTLPSDLRIDVRADVRVPTELEPGGFVVVASIDASWHDPARDTAVAALGISFRLAYECSPETEIPPALLVVFANQVAMHHAWPFLRERTRAASAELGMPSLLLPMRHATRKHEAYVVSTGIKLN